MPTPLLSYESVSLGSDWLWPAFTEIISDRVRRRLEASKDILGGRFRRLIQQRVSFGDERSKLTDKIRDYLDAIELPVFSAEPQLWDDLHQLVALRNRTVHRLREASVTAEEARWSVAVGMRMIDATMAQLLNDH